MPEQELDLLKLTARLVAKSRTCPPQIVRRQSFELGL
jgi:hypothetical protein